MSRFGFNVLGAVQSVIGKQTYYLQPWEGRERNANGYEVDTYGDLVTRTASITPVAKGAYKQLGLDFNKIYIRIFDVDDIDLLTREQNADRIIYNGYVYKALPDLDYQDWNSVLAVQVEAYDA